MQIAFAVVGRDARQNNGIKSIVRVHGLKSWHRAGQWPLRCILLTARDFGTPPNAYLRQISLAVPMAIGVTVTGLGWRSTEVSPGRHLGVPFWNQSAGWLDNTH